MNKGHILVLGGAASGKSLYAERLAIRLGQRPAYIATAQSHDNEMAERIVKHIGRRGDVFTTIEEPVELDRAIFDAAKNHDVILVDCLTLWVSNLMGHERDVVSATSRLFAVLEKIDSAKVIFVSNEVWLGIVPDNEMARIFCDLTGQLHQQLAEICPFVYFIVAGLPQALKGKLPDMEF